LGPSYPRPRAVAATIAGVVVGGLVFAVFIGLGLALLSRVSNGLPVVILGVAGAYAGWLVGVIVFGAVRGANDPEKRS
jgi:threonine/homoserine/homoserine lactone efflux protein